MLNPQSFGTTWGHGKTWEDGFYLPLIFPKRRVMKFSQTTITKFKMPAGKVEHIEFDENMPGFGLRVRAGDKGEHRTFIVQYKIGDKHRRVSLGDVRKVTLKDAQERARAIFGKVWDGKDPANEKAER